jgi:hypothetical protein
MSLRSIILISSALVPFCVMSAPSPLAGQVPSHGSATTAPTQFKKVAISLFKITGFSKEEIELLRSGLRDQRGSSNERFPVTDYVTVLDAAPGTSIEQQLEMARQEDADAAVLLEAQKTAVTKSRDKYDRVSAKLSIFLLKEASPSSQEMSGEIVSPEVSLSAQALTLGTAKTPYTEFEDWSEPFTLKTEFETLFSTFRTAVDLLAEWMRQPRNYLVQGMVPLDLLVITSPSEVELLLDDMPLGVTEKGPWRYQCFRKPGDYVLTATKEGYFQDAKPVSLAPQTKNHLNFTFKLKRRKSS